MEAFYDALHQTIVESTVMEDQLREGLRNSELSVYYQPKINVHLNQVVGMEALVRWVTEDRVVPPGIFIPIAEQSELIERIGSFVLEESCRQSVEWLDQGFPDLETAVNLSVMQLENPDLPDQVADVINKTGMPAHLLHLEITEGMMMDNHELTISVLEQLKTLGCKIAVDDFGTGYSSLRYLQRFPLDSLKVDQSFVRDLNRDDPESHTIVTAVVRLAQTLGLKVVAEGVEDEDQLQILRSLACDEIQGYLYSKPLCARDYEAWLANRLSVSTVLRAVS